MIERHHAHRDADGRDQRDERDERLLAARQQVAKRDEQLECHLGRISGNRMTSRIDGLLVSSMTSRSMPRPSPAAGGMPNSSARM